MKIADVRSNAFAMRGTSHPNLARLPLFVFHRNAFGLGFIASAPSR